SSQGTKTLLRGSYSINGVFVWPPSTSYTPSPAVSFTINPPPQVVINGYVREKTTNQAISGATVIVYKHTNPYTPIAIASTTSTSTGQYSLQVEPYLSTYDGLYSVGASKSGYFTDSYGSISHNPGTYNVNLYLYYPTNIYADSITFVDGMKGTTEAQATIIFKNTGKGESFSFQIQFSSQYFNYQNLWLVQTFSGGTISNGNPSSPASKQITINFPLTTYKANVNPDSSSGSIYIMNTGLYTLTSIKTAWNPIDPLWPKKYNLNNFTRTFSIKNDGASKILFAVVVADKDFLPHIGGYTGGNSEIDLINFLEQAVTRRSEVYRNQTGMYETYFSGLEQLTSTDFRFFIATNSWDSSGWNGDCNSLQAALTSNLGFNWVKSPFDGGTSPNHHGYDLGIVLHDHYTYSGGGQACLWNSFSISPNNDIHLSQAAMNHEIGHMFRQSGDHCDPLKGYVMCSAQDHDHYKNNNPPIFVWLDAQGYLLALVNRFN
ncbi:MAG: carboxypeptidase-like regulatory domain-containing protein, partial [Candidatus Thorarchaeota archaeon]